MDTHGAMLDWYRTRAGRRAARLLRAAVRPLLRTGSTTRLLTLGAPPGFLIGLDPTAYERFAAVGTAPRWPSAGANVALAADPCHLPFHEAMFDQLLVSHSLETAERPAVLLRELWRVLAPAGELVLVVPNRSLWSLAETTPFGQGRPYGRGELRRTLAAAMFEVTSWRTALYAPPLRGLGWSERLLARIVPGFGGVQIVTASKTDGLAPLNAHGATARIGAVAPTAN